MKKLNVPYRIRWYDHCQIFEENDKTAIKMEDYIFDSYGLLIAEYDNYYTISYNHMEGSDNNDYMKILKSAIIEIRALTEEKEIA